MRMTLFRALSGALLAASATLLTVSCENPAAAAAPPPAAAADSAKIGFEGTLTLTDYTFSDGDHATGTEGMVFAADNVLFKNGAQSLKVTGTSLANQYAPTVSFHTELILPVGATTDFTGKTVTVQVYLPTGSAVSGVNLTFFDAAGGVWMVNTEAAVTAGQWNSLSFSAADKGYATLTNLLAITKLRLRFLTGTASASVNVNVDSINW